MRKGKVRRSRGMLRWRDAPRIHKTLFVSMVALVVGGVGVLASSATAETQRDGDPAIMSTFPLQSLDGGGNNRNNPTWGQANQPYSRVAAARYADGRSRPFAGQRPARYISNRVFNDAHQNLFSELDPGTTQWGFVWGQFLDHTFGLRLGRTPGDPAGEEMNIPFNPNDPIEEFTNTLGVIPFVRSTSADGTGVSNARQQVNTVGSYIDLSAVYGDTTTRLDWLRAGSADGNPANNSANLLLRNGMLPSRDFRGDPATAPVMEIDGRLRATPTRARVAGDVRANENIGLLATHTLFAREHNRIVSMLPRSLSQEAKFQIARRIVIAEQQFITYTEFLPSIGIQLPAYRGYNQNVNATLSNEFATVGYRAHSMIHGEFELEVDADRYTAEQLAAFEELGIGIERSPDGEELELAIPLNIAFFNPDLLDQLGLGPMLQGIGLEAQYKNDEQIDNQLRSVLFQIPVPGNPDCLDGEELPECFRGVVDLGAIDIARGFDHGMPLYNQLRRAYGLSTKFSFRSVTGESTESFPPGLGIDDPRCLEVVRLLDRDGQEIPLDDEDRVEGDGVVAERRCTLAAKLRAIYGSPDRMDAFTGMLAERHLTGSNMGELQRAIWVREFSRLRDGDRFYFGNDPGLSLIRQAFGIDFRRNLGDIIALNTDIPRDELNGNVFVTAPEEPAAPANRGAARPARHAGLALGLLPALLATMATTVKRRRRA